MKTTGFFGGTFDPIHFGHLHFAIELQEAHHLSEVLFCPALCSPFKVDSPPLASASHRLAMVGLAVQGIPCFRVTNLELQRTGPSYTIDSIRELIAKRQEENEKGQMYLLLPEEEAAHLSGWKEAGELIRLAPPLIGKRRQMISSTEIRERLKKNLYCGHLVPAKVLEYIQKHGLYS